jgi:hypothetical protein
MLDGPPWGGSLRYPPDCSLESVNPLMIRYVTSKVLMEDPRFSLDEFRKKNTGQSAILLRQSNITLLLIFIRKMGFPPVPPFKIVFDEY